ncbi:MAG: MAPEG family protein [Leptospirales bacterium]|nr:MAPEG family protein [Leptospirales bacterium]
MNPSLLYLIAVCLWFMLLGLAVVSWRGLAVLGRKKRINQFPGGVQHGGDAYWRLNRAHANTAENLPLFGAVVLVGNISGAAGETFALLALVYWLFRMIQSVIHVSSGSEIAVTLRFSAYFVQQICVLLMVFQILRHAALI